MVWRRPARPRQIPRHYLSMPDDAAPHYNDLVAYRFRRDLCRLFGAIAEEHGGTFQLETSKRHFRAVFRRGDQVAVVSAACTTANWRESRLVEMKARRAVRAMVAA